jgi:hypothetical protein
MTCLVAARSGRATIRWLVPVFVGLVACGAQPLQPSQAKQREASGGDLGTEPVSITATTGTGGAGGLAPARDGGAAGWTGAAGMMGIGGLGGWPDTSGFAGQPGTVGNDGGAPVSLGPYTPANCTALSPIPTVARLQTGIVGDWEGTATTPADWSWSSATVEFRFFCDGHYQDRCLAAEGPAPEGCVALYYGTDADNPAKTYQVEDAATAEIVVYFPEATTTDDQLANIELSTDGTGLSFDLYHEGLYGPVQYQLFRRN